MGKDTTEKEQTEELSPEEETGKSSEIGSFREAVTKASEELKEKQTSEEEEVKAGEEESTCEECTATEEELKVEEEAGKKESKPKYFIATEDGKILKPLVGKARGKEYIPDSEEKLQAWLNLGIVQDEEQAKINEERAEMAKVAPFIEMISTAYRDGRLVIKDEGTGGEEKKVEEPEEEEEDEYVDPKVKELNQKVKDLESKLNKADEKRKKDKEDQFKSFVEEHRSKMKKEMEGFREKTYYAADIYLDDKPEGTPLNAWDLMAEVDGKGNPKYDLETSMKISHESQVNFVKKFIENHPEVIETEKDKIIGQHYKEKNEREKAPEGPPGERPAIPKKEKTEITGLQDGLEKFNKYWKAKQKAGAAL